MNVGERVENGKALLDELDRGRADQIAFRDDEMIGGAYLASTGCIVGKPCGALFPVHQSGHARQAEDAVDQRMGDESGDKRRGLGETGRLDNDTGEVRRPSRAPGEV
jgi:hypothetical protein